MHYLIFLIYLILQSSNVFTHTEFDLIYDSSFNYSLPDYIKHVDYFPGKNYAQTAQYIVDNGGFAFTSSTKRLFHQVTEVNLKLAKELHDKKYITKLQNIRRQATASGDVTLVSDKKIFNFLFNASFRNMMEILESKSKNDKRIVQKVAAEIIRAQQMGTAGTLRAAELVTNSSLTQHVAINLSGGYHHAGKYGQSGFCVLNDIALAVDSILSSHPDYKILVVDLDAHFGDGNVELFGDDDRVVIFDIFNKKNFPFEADDEEPNPGRHYLFGVEPGIKDTEYLRLLKKQLDLAIVAVSPDVVIYNAGTDIYKHDPLGGLSISALGIIKRDEMVFKAALENNEKAKIIMVLSGGYATGHHLKQGAEDVSDVIGRSVINLKTRFGLFASTPKTQAVPTRKRTIPEANPRSTQKETDRKNVDNRKAKIPRTPRTDRSTSQRVTPLKDLTK